LNQSINKEQKTNPKSSEGPPYKLAMRNSNPEGTIITVDGLPIGGSEITIMAGPCAVENEEQLLETARVVKKCGASILRGGAFKPRTSPYSFAGLKEEGLKLLALARQETGLRIVTEVLDTRDVELVSEYADILQIGSRNMQCFPLLEEVGKTRKPVLLKRGMSSTIKEFLLAAEYILKQGNVQIALCERGIRTFETSSRFTLDLNAIPLLKKLTHLPVIVDPSHGTGYRWMVPSMAKAAIAAGSDGLLIEVHHRPEEALSDGDQSLDPETFGRLMQELKNVARSVDRSLSESEVSQKSGKIGVYYNK
jgi:3-deoxy-7-phosphoheptulonate synthase